VVNRVQNRVYSYPKISRQTVIPGHFLSYTNYSILNSSFVLLAANSVQTTCFSVPKGTSSIYYLDSGRQRSLGPTMLPSPSPGLLSLP